jgi:hypothetical protein
METVLEECNTEDQRSVVRFLWAKGLNAKDIHKEMFPVYGEKGVFRVKQFTTGSRNSLKDVPKSQMMSDLVRKWPRQQSNTSMLRVSTQW